MVQVGDGDPAPVDRREQAPEVFEERRRQAPFPQMMQRRPPEVGVGDCMRVDPGERLGHSREPRQTLVRAPLPRDGESTDRVSHQDRAGAKILHHDLPVVPFEDENVRLRAVPAGGQAARREMREIVSRRGRASAGPPPGRFAWTTVC